jgi:hypothetical protein
VNSLGCPGGVRWAVPEKKERMIGGAARLGAQVALPCSAMKPLCANSGLIAVDAITHCYYKSEIRNDATGPG